MMNGVPNSRYFKKEILKGFLASLLLCIAGTASADDTDVFFGSAALESRADNFPNILLVLDTSGSMGNRDGGTQSRMDRMKDAVKQMLMSNNDMNIGLMSYNNIYGGGPVLYPVTYLPKVTCEGTDCAEPVSYRVNTYPVDGELGDIEQSVNGSISSTGFSLDFQSAASGQQNLIGLRFAEVNIARGATILDARLEMVARETNEEPATMVIEVQDSPNPQAFATDNNHLTNRVFNGTSVEWNPEEWYGETAYQSPDIKALVQDIISRDTWCQHNPLAFKVETTNGSRKAYTHESAASEGMQYMPKLIITQDPSTAISETNCESSGQQVTIRRRTTLGTDDAEQRLSGSNLQTGNSRMWLRTDSRGDAYTDAIGLRFQDVHIPNGATIEDARITFIVAGGSSGASMNSNVHLEDSSASVTYGSTTGGPTTTGSLARYYLPNPIPWNDMRYDFRQPIQSPDLSALIQTLVNDPDWDGSGANQTMSFAVKITSGSGSVAVYGTEDTSTPNSAPELFITYSTPGLSSGTGVNGEPVPAEPEITSTPVYTITKARDEMVKVVDGLFASGGTPTVDAFYEAALYLRGENVDYGRQRGIVHPWVPRERLRVSHQDSYTGGVVKRDASCTDGNLNSSACNSERINGAPTYISPMIGECQASHIVLLSDGETNYNDSRSKILSLTGAGACTDSGEEGCATELASWLLETDHNDLAGEQNIITHTIAYNLDGRGKEFLGRVAAEGGGTAYEADTSDQLVEVLTELVSEVTTVNTSFTAPSASVNQFNRLTHRDDLYFTVFNPSENADWDGNIKRFRLGKDNSGAGEILIRDRNGAPAIDPDTGFFSDNSYSWWPEKTDENIVLTEPDGNIVARGGAANQISLKVGIDGVAQRNVYTWIGDASSTITSPIDLTADAQKIHEDNGLITSAILNIAGKEPTAEAQTAYKTRLLQWARGVDVGDEDGDGSTTDVRRTLGDPLHSSPVIVNYASSSSTSDVRSLAFFGTNEGFLHAIDTEDGKEQFAYVPYELLGNLNSFAENERMLDRPYGLDGPITVWREDPNDNQVVDSGEKVMLYAGMRRGGNSYYALDISNPDKPKLAWTIKRGKAGFETLGQSWSRMTPVKMYINGQSEDVLVFGGGYDENQDFDPDTNTRSHLTDSSGAGIYIVRATTGQLIWSGMGPSGDGGAFSAMRYGFNGNIRTIDINRDGFVDQMYAADAGGQLWRFDIAPYHESGMGELVYGGVIADFSDSREKDHRRFYNEPDVALVENNGEKFLSVSIGSGWRAHPLDVTTEDRFYMLRQNAVYEKPPGYGRQVGNSLAYTPIKESDLLNVTSTATPDTNQYGWYLELENKGEKVLGTSITFNNKIIFTSYIPGANLSSCEPQIGSGRVYVLDVASGAPVVNLDSDSDSDPVLSIRDRSKELTRSGIPPEAMIFITADAPDSPKILIGAEQLDADISNATRRTFWSDEGKSGEILTTESAE
ncbi:MAG: VWA domain-containing protein [Granulosicoccus sp.]